MNNRKEETPKSVVANVRKAAHLLQEQGSSAIKILSDPKSVFNDRDAYLFIVDVDQNVEICSE